jgi:hypothetical protein
VRHDAVRGTFVPRIVRSTHYRSVRSRHPGSANSASTPHSIVAHPPRHDRGVVMCLTRRSRSGCPLRLRSARESDLRASSPACTGHYGVELRCGTSFLMSSSFRLQSSLFPHRELLAARPSTLPSTCSHHKRKQTHDAIAQTPNCPPVHKKLHFSTKFPSIPTQSTPLNRSKAGIVRGRVRRYVAPGQPPTPERDKTAQVSLHGLDQHENRSARVLADYSSARTASNFESVLLLTVLNLHPAPSPLYR